MSAGADDGGDDDYVCGADCSTKEEPCQHPVKTPDGRCPNHPKDGSGPPEGSGSGDPGHSLAPGDPNVDEKRPDKPNFQHGVHAVQSDPHGTAEWIRDHDPQGWDWVQGVFESYLADAPFGVHTGKANRLFDVVLMEYCIRAARQEQIQTGLTKFAQIETEDGGVTDVEIEVELPVNLPTDRLSRESRNTLKDLGVIGDEDDSVASSEGWGSAAKEVAMKRDAQDAEFVETDD